ncbi:MAG: phytoene desaturase family protein [Actinomycetes bacterium]
MARVVVVGAGMGGLAVAARLATVGHRVTLCEQAAEVGGKLGSLTRDGFTFDTGPSLLTLPAVYRDLFIKTGGPLEDSVDLVEVDPAFRYRFPAVDGADPVWLDAPNGSRARLVTALDEALGEGAGGDWAALLDRAHDIWQVTRGPFLESPLGGGRDLVRLARRTSDLRAVAPWLSLRDLGRRYLRDPRLRTMLDRYATYTGSDPRRAPAALAVIPYVEQAFGAWHVRGGLRRLADALHERAVLRGVDVRHGADVTRVELTGGRAAGVQLATGERLPADVVVSDADARHLYGDLLPAGVAGSVRRRLLRTPPSLSGFVLLLALRGRTPDLAHHTVLFPAASDAEFDAVFGRDAAPVADPAVYLCAPADPAMRPEGHEALFVLVNAPRHGHGPRLVDWRAPGLAETYADRVFSVMAERGLDVRDRVLWREVRTPADLETATRSPGGAIYGSASNGPRAAFLRPANRSPVPGLFLVGGSAHPGGGLPLVGMSAAIVAELVGPA